MRTLLVALLLLTGSVAGCLENGEEPFQGQGPPDTQVDDQEISHEDLLPTDTPHKEVAEQDQLLTIDAEYDVIIVGAGISGLSAAYSLRDYTIKVLEKNENVGGRVVSGGYEGLTYAQGAEYIGNPYGLFKEIVHELGLQPREIPSPMDAHYYDEKFYYGEDAIALMVIEHSSLSQYNDFALTIQEYYREYEWVPEFDETSELAYLDFMTAREWFTQQGFSGIFIEKYNVASRGLFGANIDDISALSFIPEIAFDYEGFKPIRDVNDLDTSPSKGRWPTGAYTFERGITEVTDALADYLGDKIQCNSTVTQVSRNGKDYTVVYEDKDGISHAMHSNVVILAVPAPIALRLAPTILSNEQKEILEQIPYATYATVALFSEVPIFDKAFDLAVPDNLFFTDVYDATWVEKYYNKSLRDVPHYIVTVYVAPQRYTDRSVLSMSDEEILDSIYKDLEKIFPGVEQYVTGYDIHRFPYAYPVMTLGAHHRLSRLHHITDGSFLLAGDYTIYPTLEAAVESGEIAAEKAKKVLESRDNPVTGYPLVYEYSTGIVFFMC
jgi:protoporphyrinogen oxidase